MTEKETPDPMHINTENSPDLDDKKAQKLVIYLPEGSVILDRSDVSLSTVPQAAVEQIAPKAEKKIAGPVAEEPVAQQLQLTLQEVVRLAVAEEMRIAGLVSKPIQNLEWPVSKTPALDVAAAQGGARRVQVRSKRKVNLVHGINALFVAYLLLVSVMPSVLSSAFGMAIYASKSSHPNAQIFSGDLMVSKVLPASELKVNDLLLVRHANSWKMDVRQVTSSATNGGISTITTASIHGGDSVGETNFSANNEKSYKVSQLIPKFGYISIILTSSLTKGFGLLALLILNLAVFIRRSKKPRFELSI